MRYLRFIVAFATLCLIAAGSLPASAQEYGTKDQAVAMVKRAAVGRMPCGVRLNDLSEGGAHLCGGQDTEAGAHATLRINGLATVLPCIVRDAQGDDAAATALRGMSMLSRLEAREAA